MKPVLLTAALVLAGASLVACGDDDGPTNASPEEFCKVMIEAETTLDDMDGSDEEQVRIAREMVQRIRDVGTPADMPPGVRDTMLKTFDKIESASPADYQNDDYLDNVGDQGAVSDYLKETCADQVPTTVDEQSPSESTNGFPGQPESDEDGTEGLDGFPSEMPTGMPTGMPSDLPSDMPEGFPTELPEDMASLLPSDIPSDVQDKLDELEDLVESASAEGAW